MKFRLGIAIGLATCLVLGGCGLKKGGKAPEGQVAATVDGKEITVIDLRNELGGYVAPDPKTRLAAEKQALDAIIVRKVLAEAAHKAGIDKTPEYAQQKQRADETLLVQAWQKKIVDDTPPPNKDEIQKFIADNPDLYANHKVFVVDQVIFGRPNDPAFAEELKPVNTLPDLEQLLTQKGMKFQTSAGQIDALSLPPAVTAQILKLPPGELFVVPKGNLLMVNRIKETQIVPVPPDLANQHALNFLKAQRSREAVQKMFGGTLAAAKDKVKFNKAYTPAVPAKAKPVAAAPAPSASAAAPAAPAPAAATAPVAPPSPAAK